jgi:hypothetical protein
MKLLTKLQKMALALTIVLCVQIIFFGLSIGHKASYDMNHIGKAYINQPNSLDYDRDCRM